MKTETRLWTGALAIFGVMLLFILTSCKKDDPKPVEAIEEIKAYKLSLDTKSPMAHLYINGVEQINLNETFVLLKGDSIMVEDKGFDTSRLNSDGSVSGKQEGNVQLKVIIDNIIVYEVSCNCDAFYTQTL